MNSRAVESIAYLNGRRIATSELAVAPTDAGFMLGITVAEQLRTFAGRLFHTGQHLDRLFHGLNLLGWAGRVDRDQLQRQMLEVADHHMRLLEPGDDVGVTVFVTPGTYGVYRRRDELSDPQITIGVHSYPLPYWLWNQLYHSGQQLWVTDYRQVQHWNWPADLKCRSRMHYYLADQAAERQAAGARALLLDAAGYVAETSTANVIGYTPELGLVAPPDDVALPGISLQTVRQLASGLGLAFAQRRITLEQLLAMNEVLLVSTPYCVVPVAQINGTPIGSGGPGPIFASLLQAWSDLVQMDIRHQADQLARSS